MNMDDILRMSPEEFSAVWKDEDARQELIEACYSDLGIRWVTEEEYQEHMSRKNYKAPNENQTLPYQGAIMETQPVKQSRVARAANFVKRNERKILITTTVVSTASAVLMRTGIKQHNEFLKEHGLYEQFYQLSSTEV